MLKTRLSEGIGWEWMDPLRIVLQLDGKRSRRGRRAVSIVVVPGLSVEIDKSAR